MQVLYALEQQMREQQLDWEEKTKLRQEKSAPILLELKVWMTQQLPLVIPKSPLSQAIAYSLPRWEGLSAYALHGQIEIDRAATRNNLAENVIWPPLQLGESRFCSQALTRQLK
ncbi:transposase [Dyadobacter sp. UP-52]|uniref:Transposase n=2 Tax=Dyadobacter subterraneus TaxID=2773304 RepID=A0ABR9WNC8_9BACT|nr:transposase [Dyadobacter subterraneus]